MRACVRALGVFFAVADLPFILIFVGGLLSNLFAGRRALGIGTGGRADAPDQANAGPEEGRGDQELPVRSAPHQV